MSFELGSPIVWWLAIVCLLVLLAITTSTSLQTYVRSVWLVLRLPGPFAWPIIGNAHWIVDSKRLLNAAVECPKKYGLVIRAWLSFYPIVFVLDPKHIQKVLSNPKHVEKTNLYKMMHNFLGTGLITIDGLKWKLHRKLMQPSFSLSMLEEFLEVFVKGAKSLIRDLQEEIKNGKKEVNVTGFVNRTVVSILTEAVLGAPIGSMQAAAYEKESPYRKGSTALQYRLLRPWLLLPAVFSVTDAAFKEIKQQRALFEFTKQAIEQRKLLLSGKGSTATCFLDHLLAIAAENETLFTEDDCAHQACTLMLAGQDSVGAALAFTLHLLASHPKEQEKAVVEQEMIFEGSDRPLVLRDLQRMTYLEQCIKEALRLYPSVPVFARTLGEDVQLDNWVLPKGCNVLIAPYATHRLPHIFPAPETFNPDRFQTDTTAKQPPYSFLPFSAGPRNCIGYKFAELEMKTILSAVLRNFVLSPVHGKESINTCYRITLRASGGLWVNVKPRDHSSVAVSVSAGAD